jgi:xylulokinase
MVGGGSAGSAWREVIRRLSGRALLVPNASELTALGAAVQATAASLGESPQDVASRWGTAGGTIFDPVERDEETLDRVRSIRTVLVDAGALGAPTGSGAAGAAAPGKAGDGVG